MLQRLILAKIDDSDRKPERYYDWIGWKLRKERKKRMKNGKIIEEQARMQSDHLEIMDMVNHPPHYNQAGIEALDAIQRPQMRAVNITYKVM